MLAKFSVRKPMTIFVAVIMVILLGIISFTQMQTDLLPNMELPYVVVYTAYPGATPEKVEQEVTKPLEQSLQTTSGLSELTSVSRENVSMIIMEFAQGTNMDSAMLEMSGYLDIAKGSFEDSVGTPTMMKINPDMMPVMVASIDVEGMDRSEITLFLDRIMPRLERVDGVASVDTNGRLTEQLKVTLNQDKIDKLNARITGELDEEFGSAERELDDARAEIESGKDKLKNEGAEQGAKLANGLNKIKDAKTQIQVAMGTIAVSLPQMQSMVAELKTQKDLLSKVMEAVESLPKLEASIEEGEQEAGVLEQGLQQLRDGLEQLKTQLAEAETAGDQSLITSFKEQIAQADTQLAEAEAGYAELQAGIADLKTKREELKVMINEAGDKTAEQLKSAMSEIDNGIAQAEQGIAQMKAQQVELKAGLAQLDATEQQLEAGKITMDQAMTEASVQLTLGESALKSAEQEFDAARDSAYEQADLDGVINKQMIGGLLSAQNFSMPAGYVQSNEGEKTVKVGDELMSKEQLEQLVLMDIGMDEVGAVRLVDVADVSFIDNSGRSYARINGNDGIILMFSKQSAASTAEVSDKINATFEELMAEHEGLRFTSLQDQGTYIDIVTGSVLDNLLYGGILAVIILIIFLGDIRPTIVIALSIPISLMFAMVLMYFSGVTLNVISLGGLALAVGMLVDNSIVAIENIYRLRSMGVPVLRASMEGAKQITGALFASTLTTVCVFMPIVFVQGIARQIFQDMGLTIAFSLLASLIVALTLVPAVSSGLLSRVSDRKHPLFDRFVTGYTRLLRFVLKHKAPVLLLAVGLLVVSVLAVPSMGMSVIPNTDINQMSATIEMPDETEPDELYAMGDAVAERISQIDEVQNVGAIRGQNVMAAISGGGGQEGANISFYIMMDEDKDKSNAQIRNEILDKTKDLDCEVTVETSTMDISTITGTGLDVEIKGDDNDTLAKIGADVADMLGRLEGTYEVSDGMERSNPEKRVVIDKEKAMEYGLTTAEVYQQVALALASDTTATSITIDGQDYPVIVSADDGDLMDEQKLEQYTFKANSMLSGMSGQASGGSMGSMAGALGGMAGAEDSGGDAAAEEDAGGKEKDIKLSEIASFEQSRSPMAITRDGQTRVLTASAMIDEGHNISLVTREFEKMLEGYEVPNGYSISIVGENEFINDSMRDAVFMIIIAVVMVYLIMVAQFQSLLSPFIIMFTIPLAFTGGLLALLLTGFELSLVAMLGFLLLSGIIVNNGIVFIDYTNELRLAGMERQEALIQTGRTRMRPILMTALTTILGLSTLALGMGMGSDMLQPLAIVTIGGLIYATALTLLVVPVMYDIFCRKPLKSRLREQEDTLIEVRIQEQAEAVGAVLPIPGDEAQPGKADPVGDNKQPEEADPAGEEVVEQPQHKAGKGEKAEHQDESEAQDSIRQTEKNQKEEPSEDTDDAS